MLILTRSLKNPILKANQDNLWEADSVFNGSVVKDKKIYHMLYRAVSSPQPINDNTINLSTIGHATSKDGVAFEDRYQFIKPEFDWEHYGCEDPRVTKFEGKYYIFYTALSNYPFNADGIKVALAITSNFKTVEEKKPITTFNAKACALFPERINRKVALILTANTDRPPAKICIATADSISDFYSADFWDEWYQNLDMNAVPLQRDMNDHIELGAAPLPTKYGWLIIYSYIKNYHSSNKIFGIEAVLVDSEDPRRIIARSKNPLLTPDEDYELYGKVPNIVFPSSALIENDTLYVYYGSADTTISLAHCKLKDLFTDLLSSAHLHIYSGSKSMLKRYPGNPIIKPNPHNKWESKYTLNPGAMEINKKIHIVYRAMGYDDTSVLGLAVSGNGFTIEERLDKPIYVPREDFEKKFHQGFSGCEDPRITRIDDTIYISYTAFDGKNATRVALSTISADDFYNHKWNFSKPVLITPPGVDDKNAGIFPERIKGKFVILHRIAPCIWIDTVDNLNFDGNIFLKGEILMAPREDKWDSLKIGIAGPPIKTNDGWLLIYHGLSREDNMYRLGVALLDENNPYQIRARLDYPILEPTEDYEHSGYRPGTVFSCGAIVRNNQLLVYYGAGDHVIGVAYIELDSLLSEIKEQHNIEKIFKHAIL